MIIRKRRKTVKIVIIRKPVLFESPHANFKHRRWIFKIYFAWINFREKPKNSRNRDILSTQKLIHVRYIRVATGPRKRRMTSNLKGWPWKPRICLIFGQMTLNDLEKYFIVWNQNGSIQLQRAISNLHFLKVFMGFVIALWWTLILPFWITTLHYLW